MKLVNLSEKFLSIKLAMEKVKFTDIHLPTDFKLEYENYILNNKADGYSSVQWAKFSTKIITSTGKSIFLPNYWFYIAFELAGYLEGLNNQKELFEKIFKGHDLQKIATTLRVNISDENQKIIKDYFELNDFSLQDYSCFISFITDYASWGGGKTIDRGDFYVSALMKAGNLLAETQGAIAEIAKQFSEESVLRNLFHPKFEISTQREEKRTKEILSDSSRSQFVFNLLSFLIEKKKQVPLFKYVIEKNLEHGNYNLEYKHYRLTTLFKVSDEKLDIASLFSGDKLRFFEEPFHLEGKYYYLSNQWTDGTESRLDIQTLLPIFNSIYKEYQAIAVDGMYAIVSISKVIELQLTKPFLLLAGISGTGKTRFVRKQAENNDDLKETYCLTAVRPDWHEPSDLLGYVSRLSGKSEYVVTDVLKFIVKSWIEIEQSGITLNKNSATGSQAQQQQVKPYWLCLDEMNLAPVEQYFADYLSVLETREWLWNDQEFTYQCDPLLKPSVFTGIDQEKLQKELGLESHDGLWQYFLKNGISIPFNLIVAGTVNMDETTHGFSRKVIDRALTFDFGEFFPNDFKTFFEPNNTPEILGYPVLTDGRDIAALSTTFDSDGNLSIELLGSINLVLANTPFKLAYRALNELLLSVISHKPQTAIELAAVWDDFLMCKVLPRIEGDIDKLTKGGEDKNILEQLATLLSDKLKTIWDGKVRPDLFRKSLENDQPIEIECRAKAKLDWMRAQLVNGFTSFWP